MLVDELRAELQRIEAEREAIINQNNDEEIDKKVEQYRATLKRDFENQKQRKIQAFAEDLRDLKSLISRRNF